MAKERLSKLQKWILFRCTEKGFVWRNEAREFYGRKFAPSGKVVGRVFPAEKNKKLVSTKAEEVSISKSFRNLENKGLVAKDEEMWWWKLSEKGFLKANKEEQKSLLVSFKDYCIDVEKKKKDLLKNYSSYRHLSGHR